MDKRVLNNLALPVFELSIDGDEDCEVKQISLVDVPAISDDFIYFSSEKQPKLFDFKQSSTEKRIVYGASMIPNLPIYRAPDAEFPEGYYVYYTEDTVEKIAHKFMRKNLTNAFNLQHSDEKNNAGSHLVESFIARDNFKELGLDLPKGTWIIGVYVEDDKVWNDFVKSGEVKGFSVEILANYLPVNFKNDSPVQQIKNLLIEEGYLKEK